MKIKQFLPRFTWLSIVLFVSQQTHHQPGSSSREQGESWAAAPARGHPGHLWSLLQRIPGARQAHSSLLLFMLNDLTQFVERLHISSCSFFPVDGDFRQDVGPMSALPKSVSSFTPACVREGEKSASWSVYFWCLSPAPPLAGRTPGGGACCASCSSLSL